MKIAVLVNLFPPKWLAGTELATYNLAKHLAKRGHEIHVITSHDKGLPNFDKENGFYVHRLAWPKIRIIGVLLFWLKIFLKIRTIKPEIVQAQDLSMGIPSLMIKKVLGMPYIVWGQGSDIYLPGRVIKITRSSILKNADAILALTEDMRKKMKEITSHEIFVVPNGIDPELFCIESQSIVKYNKSNIILFVGRLYPIKGIHYLLMAFKEIHDIIKDAELVLVGDGQERERLEALSVQIGIQDYVRFIGKVPHTEVKKYMQQADIFVLPSLSEGLPNVILEAMACGLPIVASRVGGIPDVIEDGVNGYLVTPKRLDEIAEKIVILLQNDKLREKISRNNLIKIKSYRWENIILNLEKLYLIIK
ncbi:MAG: glycosyltransferase family 4 protein [Methanolinea sp.]|nr:glycosyltransferase family 4 protein [Methanolinea sp.]